MITAADDAARRELPFGELAAAHEARDIDRIRAHGERAVLAWQGVLGSTYGGMPLNQVRRAAATRPSTMESVLSEVVIAAGRKGSLRYGLAFDKKSPAVLAAIRAQAADLVVEVSTETQAALRGVISRAYVAGQSPTAFARQIRGIVGLTRAQARAVENLENRLARRGLPFAEVNRQAAAYREKLRRYRSMNIARTETIRAANLGLEQGWQQARSAGRLPPDAVRKWIVTPDDRLCPECAQMTGATAEIGKPFITPGGNEIFGPPLHPSCRCAQGLARRDDAGAKPQAPQPLANRPLPVAQPVPVAKRIRPPKRQPPPPPALQPPPPPTQFVPQPPPAWTPGGRLPSVSSVPPPSLTAPSIAGWPAPPPAARFAPQKAPIVGRIPKNWKQPSSAPPPIPRLPSSVVAGIPQQSLPIPAPAAPPPPQWVLWTPGPGQRRVPGSLGVPVPKFAPPPVITAPLSLPKAGETVVEKTARIMESGAVKTKMRLVGSLNDVHVVTFVDGVGDEVTGYWKPVVPVQHKAFVRQRIGKAGGDQGTREVLASQVSDALEMDLVPLTVHREIDGVAGTVQFGVPGKTAAKVGSQGLLATEHEQMVDLAFFDGIIGNTDRHGGNALIDGLDVWAIDNGLGFLESGIDVMRADVVQTWFQYSTRTARSLTDADKVRWLGYLNNPKLTATINGSDLSAKGKKAALQRIADLKLVIQQDAFDDYVMRPYDWYGKLKRGGVPYP